MSRSRSRHSRTSFSSGGPSVSTPCPSARTSPTTPRTITGTSPRSSPTCGDQTHFLDAVVTPPGGTPDSVTKNGFVNQLSGYNNGSGQTSIISGVLGGEIQLTDRLRADLGVRGEYDKYVQSRGANLHLRPGHQSGDDLQQRNVRERQLPPLRSWDQGLVGVAGTQLRAPNGTSRSTRPAREATRCPRWTSS